MSRSLADVFAPVPFPPTLALMLAGSLVAGCDSPVAPGSEPCPQTYEFGNYGCARFVVHLTYPPQPWPDSRRFDLRVHTSGSGDEVLFQESRPSEGPNLITVTRWLPPPEGAGDTLSVWIRAAILEDPRPIVVGVPLPVFASDSTFHLARFSPVGSVPAVDTIRLTLEKR